MACVPNFLRLPTDEAELAKERQGNKGIRAADDEVAGDLLQLTKAGLQLCGDVVWRKTRNYGCGQEVAEAPHKQQWDGAHRAFFGFPALILNHDYRMTSLGERVKETSGDGGRRTYCHHGC